MALPHPAVLLALAAAILSVPVAAVAPGMPATSIPITLQPPSPPAGADPTGNETATGTNDLTTTDTMLIPVTLVPSTPGGGVTLVPSTPGGGVTTVPSTPGGAVDPTQTLTDGLPPIEDTDRKLVFEDEGDDEEKYFLIGLIAACGCILCIVVVVLVFLGRLKQAQSTTAAGAEKIERKQQELSNDQDEIRKLKKQIAENETSSTAVDQQMMKQSVKVTDLKEQLASVEAEKDRVKVELESKVQLLQSRFVDVAQKQDKVEANLEANTRELQEAQRLADEALEAARESEEQLLLKQGEIEQLVRAAQQAQMESEQQRVKALNLQHQQRGSVAVENGVPATWQSNGFHGARSSGSLLSGGYAAAAATNVEAVPADPDLVRRMRSGLGGGLGLLGAGASPEQPATGSFAASSAVTPLATPPKQPPSSLLTRSALARSGLRGGGGDSAAVPLNPFASPPASAASPASPNGLAHPLLAPSATPQLASPPSFAAPSIPNLSPRQSAYRPPSQQTLLAGATMSSGYASGAAPAADADLPPPLEVFLQVPNPSALKGRPADGGKQFVYKRRRLRAGRDGNREGAPYFEVESSKHTERVLLTDVLDAGPDDAGGASPHLTAAMSDRKIAFYIQIHATGRAVYITGLDRERQAWLQWLVANIAPPKSLTGIWQQPSLAAQAGGAGSMGMLL